MPVVSSSCCIREQRTKTETRESKTGLELDQLTVDPGRGSRPANRFRKKDAKQISTSKPPSLTESRLFDFESSSQ